jgi:hypothetical protein
MLLFLSTLPDGDQRFSWDLRAGLAAVETAFTWTNHVKIGSRVDAAFPKLRRPDRQPALRDEARD